MRLQRISMDKSGLFSDLWRRVVWNNPDLDYTILRPGWFTQDDKIEYRLTQKGEPFQGHDVSLNSLSDLIVKLALSPTLHTRKSLGVSG